MSSQTSKLSKRETEVCSLVKEGFSDDEIAKRLSVSLHTVRSHLKNIYQKMQVQNKMKLVSLLGNLGQPTVSRRTKVLIVESFPRIEKTLESLPCDLSNNYDFYFVSSIPSFKNFSQHTTPEIVLIDNDCRYYSERQKETCFATLSELKKSLPMAKFVFFYDTMEMMGCFCITKSHIADHIFERTTSSDKIIKILKSL